MNKFTCPVCGYNKLSEPPYDSLNCSLEVICRCCGTHFGCDDNDYDGLSWAELRRQWLQDGCSFWMEKDQPLNWGMQSAYEQLFNLGDARYEGWRGYVYEQGFLGYFICPVCGFNKLTRPPVRPKDYSLNGWERCRCCKTKFETDDRIGKGRPWHELRTLWLLNGYQFAVERFKPPGWNKDVVMEQLQQIKQIRFEGFRGWEAEQGGEEPFIPEF